MTSKFRFRPRLEGFEDRVNPAVAPGDLQSAVAIVRADEGLLRYGNDNPDQITGPANQANATLLLTAVVQQSQTAGTTLAAYLAQLNGQSAADPSQQATLAPVIAQITALQTQAQVNLVYAEYFTTAISVYNSISAQTLANERNGTNTPLAGTNGTSTSGGGSSGTGSTFAGSNVGGTTTGTNNGTGTGTTSGTTTGNSSGSSTSGTGSTAGATGTGSTTGSSNGTGTGGSSTTTTAGGGGAGTTGSTGTTTTAGSGNAGSQGTTGSTPGTGTTGTSTSGTGTGATGSGTT